MKKILICVTVLLLALGYSEKSFSQKVYDFVSVEKQPEFPGGIKKFYNFVKQEQKNSKNIKKGRVFLSFVVEENGSLSDFEINRGLGEIEDKKALEIMKKSPKWSPGMQNGKAVRVKYNIAIKFV